MSDRNPWLGAALALLCALAFSCTSTSAVLSFRNGGNDIAVISVRFIGAAILLFGILKIMGVSLAMPRRERLYALALGGVLGVQSFCLYASFERIPVGLTMSIFYIYPILVGLVVGLTGGEKIKGALWIALVIAFAGLMLVFNASGEELTTAGAVYAGLAAIGWVALTIISARALSGADARAVTFYMQLTALLLFVVVALFTGDIVIPSGAVGIGAFIALPIFYAIAITTFFAALTIIGSVRTSLIMNFEPVATITLGYLVLNQVLTGLQLLGAGLVVAALFALRWEGLKPQTD